MNSETAEVRTPPENDFHPESIAFVVTTYFPGYDPHKAFEIADTGNIRATLALQTLRLALHRGFHTIVSDGGSSKEFLETATSYNALVFDRGGEERDRGRRRGIVVGSEIEGVKAIIRTEPEKFDLVRFAEEITAPLIAGSADIVIPRRLEPSFGEFYPDYMHESENKANNMINTLLKRLGYLSDDQYLDFFFGPIALRNDPGVVAAFMERFDFRQFESMTNQYPSPENHSNAQIFPVIKGLVTGDLRIAGVDIDFQYPSAQKANETIPDDETRVRFVEKRRGQRYGIIDEVIHAIRYYDDKRFGRSRLTPSNSV